MPFSLLEEDKARDILFSVRDKLLTPYGIRSLEENDPEYKPSYRGDITSKDLAYHQGTVWSWLLGFFVTGFLRFHEKESSVEFVKELIEYFLEEHLEDAGLGSISEVFDGGKPHLPEGCVSQAWSVGEVLRCYVEDIKGIRPQFEKEYL